MCVSVWADEGATGSEGATEAARDTPGIKMLDKVPEDATAEAGVDEDEGTSNL